MSSYVLVHDVWVGSLVWQQVVSLFQDHDRQAIAVDLALSDELSSWVDNVAQVVMSQAEPVVLVGHGAAGAVISLVADQCPDHVERLVYVAGLIPQAGQSIASLGASSNANALRARLQMTPSGEHMVPADVATEAFFHDCEHDEVESLCSRLRVQSRGLLHESVVPGQGFAQSVRQYIECVEDQAIHISLQRQMARAADCVFINSLQTGHMPMLSAPAALTALIATIGIRDTRR
jgi:predicted alpha/beta hydrolase family esterase